MIPSRRKPTSGYAANSAWLTLPADVPQFYENYDRDTTWPAASLERMKAAERGSA